MQMEKWWCSNKLLKQFAHSDGPWFEWQPIWFPIAGPRVLTAGFTQAQKVKYKSINNVCDWLWADSTPETIPGLQTPRRLPSSSYRSNDAGCQKPGNKGGWNSRSQLVTDCAFQKLEQDTQNLMSFSSFLKSLQSLQQNRVILGTPKCIWNFHFGVKEKIFKLSQFLD